MLIFRLQLAGCSAITSTSFPVFSRQKYQNIMFFAKLNALIRVTILLTDVCLGGRGSL